MGELQRRLAGIVLEVNTPEALLALKVVFARGAAAAHLVSAWLISGFSLDEARHRDIRRQLAQRDAGPLATPAE